MFSHVFLHLWYCGIWGFFTALLGLPPSALPTLAQAAFFFGLMVVGKAGIYIFLFLIWWFCFFYDTIYSYPFLLLFRSLSWMPGPLLHHTHLTCFNRCLCYVFDVLFCLRLLRLLTIPSYAKRTNLLAFLYHWELLLRSKEPTQLSCFDDFIFSSLFIFYDGFCWAGLGGL